MSSGLQSATALVVLTLYCGLLGATATEAPSGPEQSVEALGCQIPISQRYSLAVTNDGARFSSGTSSISIGPLMAEQPSHWLVLKSSRIAGSLNVERYGLADASRSANAPTLVSIKGLRQQIDLFGVSDEEIEHILARCNETMKPEVASATARVAKGCPSGRSAPNALRDLLEGARPQVVIEGSKVAGWRLYGTESSANLKSQGVGDGAMVTAVCGVPAAEVMAGGDRLCCATNASGRIEATIEIGGQRKTITGPLPGDGSVPHDKPKMVGEPQGH